MTWPETKGSGLVGPSPPKAESQTYFEPVANVMMFTMWTLWKKFYVRVYELGNL